MKSGGMATALQMALLLFASCDDIPHHEVTLTFDETEVRLRVQDDGAGFTVTDPPTAAPGHFGLLGMRERIQKIGGRLTVESAPGIGSAAAGERFLYS